VTMPMHTWGEGGIIKVTDKIKSKLQLRGEVAMFVGYAKQSSRDMYQMYDPVNNSIHETRDGQRGPDLGKRSPNVSFPCGMWVSTSFVIAHLNCLASGSFIAWW
jgi:hypothetical protein